ncbi:hypothetical protein MKX01_021871 [Papaver californicum]|nr:hypothetical protein MKX01_021871 [Papaver californicum]
MRSIEDFPRLDEIHPFHGDLLHVLYNKDHYKLALGQINSTRSLISKIAKDYLKLSCTWSNVYSGKRIGLSLAYLDQIRQHMARLPSIDPNTKTILICGYPNVGKSSFINKITRADVDVQPYAFTTKSLFVGHTDYKCLRYQVIDTPGVLDRPFEDRNIIEMCSITALAHLRTSVLFFLDISGSCGYSISQQAALFHSIKSLFVNKPLTMVCNKTDLHPLDGLSEEHMKLVREMKDEAAKTMVGEGGEPSGNANVLLTMSTLTEDGMISVKNAACEKFNGGAGVYTANLKTHDILEHDEWKEDLMPEFPDGHDNVHDFVDVDILHRLEELEQEEGLRLEREEIHEDFEMDYGKEMTSEEQSTLAEFRKQKRLLIEQHTMKNNTAGNNPILPALGLNPSLAIKLATSRSLSRGQNKDRSRGLDDGGDAMDIDNHAGKKLCLRALSRPRSRSSSKPPGEVVPGEGFKNATQKIKALKLARNSSKKRNKQSRVGEADRVIANLRPKHLFSGKRSNGKTNRRGDN